MKMKTEWNVTNNVTKWWQNKCYKKTNKRIQIFINPHSSDKVLVIRSIFQMR